MGWTTKYFAAQIWTEPCSDLQQAAWESFRNGDWIISILAAKLTPEETVIFVLAQTIGAEAKSFAEQKVICRRLPGFPTSFLSVSIIRKFFQVQTLRHGIWRNQSRGNPPDLWRKKSDTFNKAGGSDLELRLYHVVSIFNIRLYKWRAKELQSEFLNHMMLCASLPCNPGVTECWHGVMEKDGQETQDCDTAVTAVLSSTKSIETGCWSLKWLEMTTPMTYGFFIVTPIYRYL